MRRDGPDTRLLEIDSLRGIAALWVTIFHFSFGVGHFWLAADPDRARQVAPFRVNIEGNLGVDLFFMISGFVIYMTLQRTRTPWDFVVSRFSRLYPAYWACLAITTIVILLVPVAVQKITVTEILVNITMLNMFVGVRLVEPTYWSLAIELAFYAGMMAVFLAGRLDRIEFIGAVWLVLSVLVFKVFSDFGHSLPTRVQAAMNMQHTPLFLAGILLYRVRFLGWTPLRAGLFIACFLSQVLPIPVGPYFWGSIAIIVVFAVTALGWAPFLAVRPLIFLGNISYALYLLHQSIGFRIQDHVVMAWGASAWAGFFVALSCVIALATAVTYLVEKPAQRWIKRHAAVLVPRYT